MKHWTQEEIEFIKNEASKGVEYKEISKNIGRTGKAISIKMQKLGFVFSDFYTPPIKYCECCAEEIKNDGIKYCSHSCSAKITNVARNSKNKNKHCIHCGGTMKNKRGSKFCSYLCQRGFEYNLWIKSWKNGEKVGYSGKGFTIAPAIRKYLFEKYNNKCCKCGWCEVHPTTNKIPLQVDHIDGDASNNKEENLQLICPNCHSQTETYSGKSNKSCKLICPECGNKKTHQADFCKDCRAIKRRPKLRG